MALRRAATDQFTFNPASRHVDHASAQQRQAAGAQAGPHYERFITALVREDSLPTRGFVHLVCSTIGVCIWDAWQGVKFHHSEGYLR